MIAHRGVSSDVAARPTWAWTLVTVGLCNAATRCRRASLARLALRRVEFQFVSRGPGRSPPAPPRVSRSGRRKRKCGSRNRGFDPKCGAKTSVIPIPVPRPWFHGTVRSRRRSGPCVRSREHARSRRPRRPERGSRIGCVVGRCSEAAWLHHSITRPDGERPPIMHTAARCGALVYKSIEATSAAVCRALKSRAN